MVFDNQVVVDHIAQQVRHERRTGPRRFCPTRLTMSTTATCRGSARLTHNVDGQPGSSVSQFSGDPGDARPVRQIRSRRTVAGGGFAAQGIIPGIKVDRGLVPLAPASAEQVTDGLDGLAGRLVEYRELGAQFAKWRAISTSVPACPR